MFNIMHTFGSERFKESMLRIHNVEHWSQTQEYKRQIIEKYGVENIFQLEAVKAQSKQTKLKRYNDDNYTNREQAKKTYLENYGVDHPMKSNVIKAKFNFRDIVKKAHITKKKNKSYTRSKIEDDFYKLINAHFDNVIRNVSVCNWSIDFYIKSINTYIQFDGMYWHGLDRPIEEIKKFKSKQDVTIYGSYLRDIKQDEYFKENNLRLIRITDTMYKTKHFSEIINIIGSLTK